MLEKKKTASASNTLRWEPWSGIAVSSAPVPQIEDLRCSKHTAIFQRAWSSALFCRMPCLAEKRREKKERTYLHVFRHEDKSILVPRLFAINTAEQVERPGWRSYGESDIWYHRSGLIVLVGCKNQTFGMKNMEFLLPPTTIEIWSQETTLWVFWSSRRSQMQKWKRIKSHKWDRTQFRANT